MIGQKGFFKTSKSNFSSGSSVNLDGAIISSAPSTAPTPPPSAPVASNAPAYNVATSASASVSTPASAQTGSSSRPPKKLNPVFLVVLSVLSTAAVGALVYFLFLAPRPEKNETPFQVSSETVAVGSSEEILNAYDAKIADAKTDAEILSAKIDKATFGLLDSQYQETIDVLNTIDVKSLNDGDQYAVYNHYASAYQGLGDYTNAEKYQKLAQEALERTYANAAKQYLNSGTE